MRILVIILVLIVGGCSQVDEQRSEIERWEAQAKNITIIRDKWGIPHIYGKTDADTVFGALYAQAEDDFKRVELNYINAMGRLAEAEGEEALYHDLRMKLFIDPEVLKAEYEKAPDWLKKLMNAFADGLNYYLHTHPEVKPRVIKRFEPWMALAFTEGSIGGDIEIAVNTKQLQQFYEGKPTDQFAYYNPAEEVEPSGSNGFAIAPKNTRNGNALLLINPHTSFYFRAELHMVSEEGLNAYGAVTWGQFFIYQGFNENAGWMHTSSGVDAYDWYRESIVKKNDGLYYKYGDELRKLQEKQINLPYKTDKGMKVKQITTYHSHHGPVIAGNDDKWVSVKLMNEPLKALQQSYLRTKTTDFYSYKEVMRFHTNSSNNTIFADSSGNIAYFHGNYVPVRDDSFNWNKPVDGSNLATEWNGLHTIEESPLIVNPETGWLQNTNNNPWSVIGEGSPKAGDYPKYMDRFFENYRGINAVQVLKDKRNFTVDSLIEAAYDPKLGAFDDLLPILFDRVDNRRTREALSPDFMKQMEMLKAWDRRSSVYSVETTLAIYWGRELRKRALADKAGMNAVRDREISFDTHMIATAKKHAYPAYKQSLRKLVDDFGTWQMPWGKVNRFQRLTADIVQPFDDSKPSHPVGFASSRWGSLAAYGQRTFNGTKKTYGTRGNSFVAVVEFGKKLRAKAVSAGGQSGDVNSYHFDDQADLYASGTLRDVYFYRKDVEYNAHTTYSPGQKTTHP